MDYLRRLFSYSRERQTSTALSSSILKKVPVEVLLCIMDCLPFASAVAFSLSCMYLKHVLGTRHISGVSASTEDTLALLNLLALDLPDHVVCSTCKRLHKMQNLLRYSRRTYSAGSVISQYNYMRFPVCVTRDGYNNIKSVTSLFGTAAFKMAIKRYRQNPECTELLKIMSSDIAKTMYTEGYVRQHREECRVVRGLLLHRLQSVYILRQRSSTARCRRNSPPTGMICPHIKFAVDEHRLGSGAKTCQKCRTEYRYDFQYYEGHGLATFFTRWKDLGADPEDEVWTQHLKPIVQSFVRRFFMDLLQPQTSVEHRNQPEVRLQEGELSSAFGDSDDFKFDSLLTLENKAELFRFQDNA